MRLTSLLLLSPLLASAFTVPHHHNSPRTALQVSAERETGNDINLILNGNNIELTPALNEYVEKRIGSPLRKLGGGGVVREVDVHLSVYKNPKVCDDPRGIDCFIDDEPWSHYRDYHRRQLTWRPLWPCFIRRLQKCQRIINCGNLFTHFIWWISIVVATGQECSPGRPNSQPQRSNYSLQRRKPRHVRLYWCRQRRIAVQVE